MSTTKRMNLCSRDIISCLPDSLICHILSFVTTKEAASTSVLAKRWRYLFALTPNLDFDDSLYVNLEKGNKKKYLFPWTRKKDCKIPKSFVDFVDRALVLHQNVPLKRFSLKCEDVVHNAIVVGWILKVLAHGVLDLDIQSSKKLGCSLPSEMFVSETLVRLKIGVCDVLTFKVKDVSLPKVKTLCLDCVIVKNSVFAKLLSGCHALEELVLNNFCWEFMQSCSVSNRTVKRLVFLRPENFDFNHKSVSFDTPSLVYLKYSDTIANEYPKVNFTSLVKASLDLRMTCEQIVMAKFRNGDRSAPEEMVGNATEFFMGICNVKILYLSEDTLEVLNYCCKPIPKFNNLTHITIKTNSSVAWESLPALLNNCPKLETLVFKGLHKYYTCKEGCLCKLCDETRICLSSSPVKVLKVLKFGEILGEDDIDEQIKQVQYFLETMPKLEQLILFYDTYYDEDVNEVSTQLHGHPRVASSKCKIQVISDNLCLSCIAPSSVTTKMGRLL